MIKSTYTPPPTIPPRTVPSWLPKKQETAGEPPPVALPATATLPATPLPPALPPPPAAQQPPPAQPPPAATPQRRRWFRRRRRVAVPPPVMAPNMQPPATVIVRGGGGGVGGFVVGVLVFLLFVGAAGGYVLWKKRESERNPIIIREEAPVRAALPAGVPAAPAEMKPVVIDPEKDGVRGPVEYDDSLEQFNEAVHNLFDDLDRPPTPKEIADNVKAQAGYKPPATAGDDGEGMEKCKKVVRKTIDNRALKPKERLALQELMKKSPDRVVDVLAVYSVSYKYRYGGPKGVYEKIQWQCDGANAYYKSRGVNGMLRIVGVVQSDYQDTERVADLRQLSRGGVRCGRESIEDLRRLTGADIVVLYGTKGGGGVAHCPGQFAIVKRGSGSGIFQHELQHTFGWKHEHGENLWKVEAAFPRSAGYRPTVMPLGKVYIQYRDATPKGRM